MKFSKEITINVPADKLWGILAHNFTDVGTWARSISKSVVNEDSEIVNNSPVGGRICDTSIGHIKEEFVTYDEAGMTYSFKGEITSIMLSDVISTNTVVAIDENTSKVIVTPSVDLKILGFVLYPLIRMNLSKTINEVLLDLKYFAENDAPSPEKQATQNN